MKIDRDKLSFNLIAGVILVGIVALPALIGIFWTPFDPNEMNGSLRMAGPALAHPLGCDNFGRDILSRIMKGCSTTFVVGICTVIIGCVSGTVIGALTGYFGGAADEIIMRINDVIMSFPSILLALVIVAVFKPGRYQVTLALGIAFIPGFARIVRAEFIRIKNMDYVKMARLSGAGEMRIIFVHMLPNSIRVIISSLLIGFNNAVLAEAGLSFLGIGITPPNASLGSMLNDSQTYLFSKPGLAIIPGITIIIMVLGVALLSKEIDGR